MGIYHQLREMLSEESTLKCPKITYKLFIGRENFDELPEIMKLSNGHSKYKLGVAYVESQPVGWFLHKYRKNGTVYNT